MFNDEIKKQHIFHIPHSSISMPNYDGVLDTDLVDQEILKLTDWATDIIFDVDGIDTIRTPFSRVFCDVERFNDESEPMNKFGRGVLYSKTESGNELRDISDKEYIIEDYYDKHHKKFELLVDDKLKDGNVYIIDVHSFPNIPLSGEINSKVRPDICIGYDEENADQNFILPLVNYFKNNGYTVSINEPYSGSIVPIKYIGDKRVQSVMIELNRDLYMIGHLIDTKKLIELNKLINNYMNNDR